MTEIMLIILKLTMIAAILGILRSSTHLRQMSQEVDETAWILLKRMMRATEESGYPPETLPLLIGVTALALTLAAAAILPFGR